MRSSQSTAMALLRAYFLSSSGDVLLPPLPPRYVLPVFVA